MDAFDAFINKLAQPSQTEEEELFQKYGLLPKRIQAEFDRRAAASPGMKPLKDISKVMQAGPVLAAAAEAGAIRGGSGVNLNPLMKWASGLPGANKEQLAALQTKHRSPTEIVGGLMGLGDAASQSAARYAQNFRQAGGGVSGNRGGVNPITMLMLRDMLNQRKRDDQRAYDEGQEKERLRREEETARKKMSLEDQRLAHQIYERWQKQNSKKGWERIQNNASSMFNAYKTNPDSLYLDVFGHKWNKKSWPSFAQSAEGKQFYAALQGFINPILKGDIGSQQTRAEAERFNKALSVGAFDSFDQLRKSYNKMIDGMIREYDRDLNVLRSSPGNGHAYKYYWQMFDKPSYNYAEILKRYKLPNLTSGATKKGKGRAAPKSSSGQIQGGTDEAKSIADELLNL